MNSDILSRFIQFKTRLERQHGEFVLFGLFQQAEGSGNWDVVFSTTWKDARDFQSTRFFVEEMAADLRKEDILKTRGVFVLDPNERFVRDTILRYPTHTSDPPKHLANVEISGLAISEAYILVAAPPSKATNLDQTYFEGELEIESEATPSGYFNYSAST